MSKHAPGPWMFVEDKQNVIMSSDDFAVAEVFVPEDGPIIAAAPELLEALENLLKVHEGEGGTQYNAADIARAAIAKAKGEEQ